MEEHVLNTFGSWETNLLVTVDKQTKEDIKHFCDNLINTIKEKSEKKIVIITPVITDNSNEGDLSMSTIFTELKADYVKNERDKTEFTDLKQNSQKTIIETAEINFQGSKMKLNELIDENVLSTLIDAKTLQKIIEGEEIIIGKPLESVTESECYVRRKIRLIKVSDRIFGESELLNKDLFVLQGTDAKKLLQKKTVEKEQIIDANYFIHNELCDVKKLFIVLQNYKAKTQFSQIVKKYPNHCVHWLITESNTLFWFYSHVPPSVSLKTFGTYVYRDEEYIEESFFYEYVKQNQTVIIADIAGMGKSTILTSFAKALQNNKRWKIRINLNQYMTILANIKEKFSHMEISEVEILKKGLNLNFDNFKSDYEKLILESIIASETHTNIIQTFENRLFSYFFAKRGILYIFDGFDEISPNYGKIVLQLLQMLRQNDKNRIWITSRTHFKEMLEYKFNTFAYDMKPFDRNDQAIFLKEYWINNYRNEKGIEMPNQDRLPLYIEKLLDEASQIIGDIIGITLQTKMLAEIFQENHDDENDQNSWISCFEYADNISQEVNISSKLANVFSLFENFFREKVIKYFSNENGFTHLKKPLAKKAKKYTLSAGFAVHKVYGYLALIGQNEEETLLSDNEKKTKKELTIDFQNIIKNIGIIGSFNSDGYPLFNHLTYAEYFAACFLIDKLCTSPSHAEQIFKVANEIFKKDVPVFVECLKYKLKQKLDNKVLETGLNNKTVLKFVTENGFLNCVHVFLNSKGFDDDFPGDDIQFGSNILNYAAEYGHANVVIYIILRFSKLITQLTDITNHPSGLFHYLCKLIYNGKIKTIISPNKLITQLFEKIKVVAEHDIKPKKDIEMEEIMRYNSLQNCAKISNADEAMSKIEFSNFYSHILNRLSFYSIMMFLDVSKSHSDQYHRPPSNEYMNFIEVVCTKSDMNDTEKLEIFKRFDDTTKAWKITAKIFQQIAAYGYLTLLQMLLECNDFDISYETYFQCFSGACRSDNLEIVKLILPYLEKDPHCYNFGNLLNEALFHVTKLDIIKYVTEGKQNIINNALNKNDETALILAVKKKYNIQTVKYLVKEGADPNKTNKSGESSWTLAIKENRTDIIKCFTDNNLYPKDKSSKEYLNNFTMVDEDHDKMISIYYDDRKTNLKKMKMLLYKYNNDLNVAAKDFEILNLLVKDFECAMYFLQNGVIIQSLYNEVCFRKPRGTGNVRILKYISILHEFTEYIKCREYTPESIIKYYDHYVTKTLNYLYPTNDKNAVGKIIAAVRLEIEDKNVGRVEVKTLLEIAQNANEKILIDWLQSITEAVNKFEVRL
uniref:NACHT domain-containing protein n=1 Tax=Panagrolaimus davidi TaxID=227884 RepID=A0A914QTY2_9BILA